MTTIKIDTRTPAERLRVIPFNDVVERTAACCFEAACQLPADVLQAIRNAADKETSQLGKGFLQQYIENAKIASEHPMPICQDTGFAVFFVEMGEMVKIDGGSIYEAITAGVAKGYKEGYLRKSIVRDPLFGRPNTGDNTPPIIHLTLVPGDKLNVVLAPKGGGSENMSALKMLKPSDGREGVVKFVTETVIAAGGNPCPPTVVGVGIGGTFEKAAFLAKKALLRKLGDPNPQKEYAELEQEILAKINASGVGPQGLGGDITSFAVHIEEFPCHIASLPVAVNLNCHAARHAGFEL
jgi:fumarate hydratase subunit alpha